ncbi:hypothetical protein ACQJBY_008688 [Aegilops geniculata]
MMFQAMRAVLSAAKSGAAGRAGRSSRFLSASPDSRRLAGKVAVITGRVTAAEFVRSGARVVLADVQDELGRAAAAELGGPDTACYTRCDVTDEAQVAAAVDLAVARHGRLDVMFNNAGITGGNYAASPIESLDMADFDRVMAVNLRGVAAGIKHAARAMAPRGEGCILCTSSTAGALAGSGPHAYSVSKTAVVGMVRSAAAELAARGVRVNAISPYAIATPMGARAVRETPGTSPGITSWWTAGSPWRSRSTCRRAEDGENRAGLQENCQGTERANKSEEKETVCFSLVSSCRHQLLPTCS